MNTDKFAKAVRMADKTKARPDKVVITSATTNTKPPTQVLSARLYTRITPSEMRRFQARVGNGSQSAVLRDLVLDFLARDHGK